jgi:hypothetical protein
VPTWPIVGTPIVGERQARSRLLGERWPRRYRQADKSGVVRDPNVSVGTHSLRMGQHVELPRRGDIGGDHGLAAVGIILPDAPGLDIELRRFLNRLVGAVPTMPLFGPMLRVGCRTSHRQIGRHFYLHDRGPVVEIGLSPQQ